MAEPSKKTRPATPESEVERRRFLEGLGKYAAVTPPAFAAMLSAASVPAHAKGSGMGGEGGEHGGGGGEGGEHGGEGGEGGEHGGGGGEGGEGGGRRRRKTKGG